VRLGHISKANIRACAQDSGCEFAQFTFGWAREKHIKTRGRKEHRNALPRERPKISGGDFEEATPDPIPNSEVKLFGADGTAMEALWESRTPPGFIPKKARSRCAMAQVPGLFPFVLSRRAFRRSRGAVGVRGGSGGELIKARRRIGGISRCVHDWPGAVAPAGV
jgi:hypothetical protein